MMNVVRAMVERVSFRDVRRNRYCGSGELGTESISFGRREMSHQLVDEFREIHSLLPNDEIAIVVNRHNWSASVSPNVTIEALHIWTETLRPEPNHCATR